MAESKGLLPVHGGLTGRWRFELRDGKNRSLDLTIVQNGRAVFGQGSIDSATTATASGTISGSLLYLDVIRPENLTLYRCTLNLGRDILLGSYYVFESPRGFRQGRISGTRRV